MKSFRILFLALLLSVAAALTPTLTANASAPATSAPYCGITWGSGPKSVATMGLGEVDTVRTGRHQCFDRVVIDIDGPPAGYSVQYVPEVTADGSGAVVPTKGGAKLQVVVRHPSFAPTHIGQSVAPTKGFRTLRSVVYAGSFEGQTTYGVGVRARLPFRVFTIPGGHGRIVLDIAHKW